MEGETYASIWAALADSPAEAANLKARSALLSALTERVQSWQTTQQNAADRLGITRPRLNDLLRGKLAKFSLDALWNLSVAAGLSVEIHVQKTSVKPAQRTAGKPSGDLKRFCVAPG